MNFVSKKRLQCAHLVNRNDHIYYQTKRSKSRQDFKQVVNGTYQVQVFQLLYMKGFYFLQHDSSKMGGGWGNMKIIQLDFNSSNA